MANTYGGESRGLSAMVQLGKNSEAEKAKERSRRKAEKRKLNSFLDSALPSDKIDLNYIQSFSDDVFETHTSDEDNPEEFELCELGDPWMVQPAKTVTEKYVQSSYVNNIIGYINDKHRAFSSCYKRPEASPMGGDEKGSPIKLIRGIEEGDKRPAKKTRTNGGKALSAFENIPDELSAYLNSKPSILANFGSNNTLECNKCFKRYESLLNYFNLYLRTHLLKLLPDDVSTGRGDNPQSFSFVDDDTLGSYGDDFCDFHGSVIAPCIGRAEWQTSKETKITDFGIVPDHKYTELNQFKLLNLMLQPLTNRVNAEGVSGIETQLQSGGVIQVNTAFLTEDGNDEEQSSSTAKPLSEKVVEKMIWEVSTYWLSKENQLVEYQYDMFLFTASKYTVYHRPTTSVTTNPKHKPRETDTEKVLKTFLFLHCEPPS